MATFDFQGKEYSTETIPEQARATIDSLSFVKKLKTELEAKKIVVTRLLNSIRKKDNLELNLSSERLNVYEMQEQLTEISNKLQVIDTARLAYSKQLQATLVESDS